MEDQVKDKKETKQNGEEKSADVKIGPLTWAIMAVIVIVLSGSGFFLGRLLAFSPSEPDAKAPPQAQEEKPVENAATTDAGPASDGTWYYKDMESVVVNPNEPGATRFVRVGLILEVSNEINEEEATAMFAAKNPLLINWLNLYFKSLSLSQMENEKDMKRILSQICDGFNEILFPDTKPQIKKVLIREFNIQ